MSELPRVALAALPTPLERIDRFGAAIGAEVWIKRDDAGPVGLAGNKVRKLEYVLADAMRQRADAIVAIGAQQSNAARATAAACASLGLRCVLVLDGDEPEAPAGNLLLDRLFGAEIHFAGDVGWTGLRDASERLSDDLREQGAAPYTLPAGSSSPLGACGFAAAWAELAAQLAAAGVRPRTLFHASSSGGTLAGLMAGRAIGGDPSAPELRPIGVAPDLTPDVDALAREAAALAGAPSDLDIPPARVDMAFAGGGYAVPTEAGADAIRLLARTEGIVCDPIYSGKALAALVAADHDGPAVFWHTGGWHALFAPRFGATVA